MATDRADTTAAATDRVADASTLLDELADRAQHYVAAASATNTRRAYAADWRHFTTWCRQQNLEPAPSNPRIVGLYITACASGAATADRKPNAVTTIERRLSALSAHYTQLGMPLDRTDRHIATVLAGIRNTHARPRAKRNPC
jgi:site-specific recombinase XerD